MISVLRTSWPLLLGIMLLLVGNGMQGTLLGIRGGHEQISTDRMAVVMAGYFAGFLLGSRRYTSTRDVFPSGTRLRIDARCELLADNGLGMFACSLQAGDEQWAMANVSVFEPADAMAYLESGEA